ncbi:Opi1-domain-containing protein [Ramaria rubella]|nr:Opi1-domain-containing protein [Ramaria rubella]
MGVCGIERITCELDVDHLRGKMSSSRLSLADLCLPTDSMPPTPTSSMASSSSSTPVHAGIKRPLTIDDQDEDVRIAVRALGDMRSRAVAHAHAPSAEAFAAAAKAHSRASSISQSTPFLTHSSTSASTSSSSPISPRLTVDHVLDRDDSMDPSSKDFVSRVSRLPVVNTALKAYENSKERSRVVKYGANLMESSVKTISRPVIDRLPVEQIDEFACRQLDRFGYPGRNPNTTQNEFHLEDPSHPIYAYREPPIPRSGTPSRAPSLTPSSNDGYSTYGSPAHVSQKIPDSLDKTRQEDRSEERNNDRQVASRSKWQAVLLEAGGIGAAVSEESMKRLQYCLQWLQYATEHIDSRILLLRSFIDSLSPHPHQSDPQALVPLQTMRSLTDVRRDVVSTIRQVVDVISRYAGSALPEPARATVRTFILRLPARWASANTDPSSFAGISSAPSSPTPNSKYYGMPQTHEAPSNSADALPPHMRPTAGRGTHPTAGAATQTAQRILALAVESLDMMRSVTNVFKESLDRAEAWVERLRVVGIQRQGQGALPPPPPNSGPSLNDRVQRRACILANCVTFLEYALSHQPVARDSGNRPPYE